MPAAPTTFPDHGAVVVFAKVPAGSYCSEGVRYRVERPTGRGAFRFVNVERGSSTYDQPYAVAVARWAEAA